MKLLDNSDAQFFVSTRESLLHPRSRSICSEAGIEIYQLYELYKAYKSMALDPCLGDCTILVRESDVPHYLSIFASATVVYFELSLRERVSLPLPASAKIPILVNSEPKTVHAWCVATIKRGDIAPEYFVALATNLDSVYQSFLGS